MLSPIQNDARDTHDLSGLWDFQADPAETGERDGWPLGLPAPRAMAVPGSWNEQYADLFHYFGLGWYVRRAYVPGGWQGQRVFIRVGSACYLGTAYVNGVRLGTHAGGHLPFAFEITEHVKWGQANVFAISVENHLRPERVPAGGRGPLDAPGYPATPYDFFPYTGLHRPVVLYAVPQTHVADVTVVTKLDGPDAALRVSVSLNGGGEAAGRVVLRGADQTLEAGLAFAGGAAEATLAVPAARLWSPEDPFLYDLEVFAGRDHYTLPVGLRTIAVDGARLLLNGRPVALRGFGRHEDFPASGRGLNLPLLVKDYQLMRWVGANSYRTSHYPYSEEAMALADQEGFLIIDEIPAVSLEFHDAALNAERLRMCRQQLAELIARDKNHPSVIVWSVANEPLPPRLPELAPGGQPDPAAEAAGKQFLDALLQHARALDPTRPVTLAGVMGAPLDWLAECDVICLNRYYGWYVQGGELDQGLARLEQELDDIWARFGRPVILTEFGADSVAGLHAEPAVMWSEEYQAELIRGYLEVAARKDFVAGMHVWNFADFAAAQSTGRVGGHNLKGVFTRTREPKLAAQVLRQQWGGER